MAIALPLSFLLLQCALLVLARSIATPAAYLTMVVAPLLCAIAASWRARREPAASRFGWSAIALALVIWAAGAFGNLWQEWVLQRHFNEMYRSSMLAFNLATVPTVFLLASDWRPRGRLPPRLIDAALALALGYAYFLVTWTMITDRARPEEVGVAYLVWLVDAQNLFVACGALVRWYIAEHNAERDLFRALAVYQASYFGLAFVNNHYFAQDAALGPEYGTIITIAFAALAASALATPSLRPIGRASRRVVRAVRTASPIVLSLALLIVSLFLIRADYPAGTLGILIAVLGYGARTTLTQVRHIERGAVLRRQHTELRAIAWTDALTGVANRHWLDVALRRACRDDRRTGRALGILMVDIDHFKLFNDQFGHLAGDACLRDVARALRQTLLRPGDLLARYGGEEFVVLLRDIDADGAQVVAERLCAAVKDLAIENPASPFGVVTVSIGAAVSLVDGSTDPARLVEAADRALYVAKCAGRNQARSALAAAA